MKIAIINPWYIGENSVGGTERFVKDLARQFTLKGHSVDVFMLSGKSYQSNGINFISMNIFGQNVIADEYMLNEKFGSLEFPITYEKIAKEFENKFDMNKYDFLQINSHLFLKCWQNKKRIFTIHSNYEEFVVSGTKKEFEVMVDIMKEQTKKQTYFVVVSKAYFKTWKDILTKNVVSIPHAIDESRLECDHNIDEILKKYDLSKQKLKFLLPSRLEPIQKRPELILKACALLDEKIKQKMQIVFTGLDPQYEKFINQLKQLAIQNKIDAKFVKFENIVEGYCACECVVVPSKSESFGYSALEGLMLGKPTFLSNIPTFHEIGKGNKNAFFFDDEKEFAQKIKKVILKNLSMQIPSDRWKSRFDISTWADKYLKV